MACETRYASSAYAAAMLGLTETELFRRGIKPSAPIVSFVRRLRCQKCGSQSVRAERVIQKRAS